MEDYHQEQLAEYQFDDDEDWDDDWTEEDDDEDWDDDWTEEDDEGIEFIYKP